MNSTRQAVHVLVVDDDASWRHCVSLALAVSHRVSQAADGMEAIELIEGGDPIDAILLDLMMPRCTGPEVFAWLEANCPELTRRTVIMTGGTPTPAMADFYEQTCCPKLTKPITPADVVTAVEQIVAQETATG